MTMIVALHIAWFVTFLISLLTSNLLCLLIKNYTVNQPQGNLSLFVSMVKDICCGIQAHSTTHCLLGILSRFEFVTEIVKNDEIISIFICTVAELFNTTTLVHLGSFCLIRILCLRHISFMEETVGEKATRIVLFCFSFVVAVANCFALVVSEDIVNGTVFNMMSRQVTKAGKDRKALTVLGLACCCA
jgi:hypothetical protein